MAITFESGVFYATTTGVLKERTEKLDTDPIRVKAFVFDGTGTVTIKDNQASPGTLLVLTGNSTGSVVVPFGSKGFTFPFGLSISNITGGSLSVFVS